MIYCCTEDEVNELETGTKATEGMAGGWDKVEASVTTSSAYKSVAL